MAEKIYEMTLEGIKKLEAELEKRKNEERAEIAERIEEARGFGDLSENSEYEDAKNAQGENESRIIEIENILKHVKVIEVDEINANKVKIGAIVLLREEDSMEEIAYTLVGTKEANIFENKISTESPVGAAILGKTKGTVVDVKTPSGTVAYKIVKISKPEN